MCPFTRTDCPLGSPQRTRTCRSALLYQPARRAFGTRVLCLCEETDRQFGVVPSQIEASALRPYKRCPNFAATSTAEVLPGMCSTRDPFTSHLTRNAAGSIALSE